MKNLRRDKVENSRLSVISEISWKTIAWTSDDSNFVFKCRSVDSMSLCSCIYVSAYRLFINEDWWLFCRFLQYSFVVAQTFLILHGERIIGEYCNDNKGQSRESIGPSCISTVFYYRLVSSGLSCSGSTHLVEYRSRGLFHSTICCRRMVCWICCMVVSRLLSRSLQNCCLRGSDHTFFFCCRLWVSRKLYWVL